MSARFISKPLLIGLAAVAVVFAAGQSHAHCLKATKQQLLDKSAPFQEHIQGNSKKYRVDSNLIRSVIAIESCYNAKAISPKGAQGLMQLIPDTAERFGISDSFSPKQNIRGGTRYLRFLLDRYQGDMRKVLAAYNAGEGVVDHYKGIPPYPETKAYVKNVLITWNKLSPRVSASNGRVVGKPGRVGYAELKRRAPHLFKQ